MDSDTKIGPSTGTPPLPPPPPPSIDPAARAVAPELSYATPEDLDHPHDWTSIEVFTLDPAQRNRFILQVAVLSVGLRLLLLAAITVVMLLMHAEASIIVFVVCVVCVLQVSVVIRVVFRTRRTWPTYRLVIGDQGFITTALGRPRVRVDAAEISRITATFDGYKVALRGGRQITISGRVLDAEALSWKLRKFGAIAPGRGAVGLAAQIASTWAVTLTTIVLFYVGLFTEQSRTALYCAAFCVPLIAHTIWRSLRMKGLPLRARIAAMSLLTFPVLLMLRWAVLAYVLRR